MDGVLYESTGLNGRSGIRKVNLATGEVLQIKPLDAAYFGEGITVWKNRIVQLTWQSGLGFVYDRQTFEQQRTFRYSGEGWGLTHDGDAADHERRHRDASFPRSRDAAAGRLRDGQGRAAGRWRRLNELEYVKGEIYANVWQTERIAVISPASGRVTSLDRSARPARSARGGGRRTCSTASPTTPRAIACS